MTEEALRKGLDELIPKFIGFIVSFIVVGMYWFSHHRLFYYVDHFHSKLLWANLLFLMPIAVMPFSSAFLSEYYIDGISTPMIVYTTNIVITGVFSFRLWSIVANKKNHISNSLSKPMANYNKTRALIIPGIFVLLVFVGMLNSWLSYFILPIAPPLATFFIKRYYKKHHPELEIK